MTRHLFASASLFIAGAAACLLTGCGSSKGGAERSAQLAHADTLARSELELGRLAHAYYHLLAAQAISPDRPEVRADLARTYLIFGKPVDARDQAFSISDADSLNIMVGVLLGASATTPAQIDEAIRRLESARSRFGTDPRPRIALASLYQRKSQPVQAEQFFKEAVESDARSAEAHALLGAFYARQGNAALASEEAKTAAGIAPLNSNAAVKVAESFLLYGQREQAKTALRGLVKDTTATAMTARRVLAELALADRDSPLAAEMVGPIAQKDSADVEALLQLARTDLLEQKSDDAIKGFRRAIAIEPGLAPSHYYLGMALAEAGKVAEAQAQLDTAIKLTRNYPEAVAQLAALNVRADIPRASIAEAERQVKLNPRSMDARRVLGEVLIGAGRATEADEVFRDAAKRAPDRPEPHYWLGVSLFKQGRMPEARDELETALKISPDFTEAMAELVTMDLSAGKSDSALARVTNFLRVRPQSADLYDLLGAIHERRNEPDAAEAAYVKSTQLDPNLANPHARLANFYAARQKFELAVVQGEAARKLDSKNVPALVALGVAYQAKGDVGHARAAYEQALAADRNSTAAANNLAYLLSESDQTAALRYALMALKTAPNDPHIKDTAGWILYQAGRYGDALTFLRESGQRLPNSPDVQYHLGMAAEKTGDTATARRALALAVAATIDFPGKDDARKALALLK